MARKMEGYGAGIGAGDAPLLALARLHAQGQVQQAQKERALSNVMHRAPVLYIVGAQHAVPLRPPWTPMGDASRRPAVYSQNRPNPI
jgi:hypothetical protein